MGVFLPNARLTHCFDGFQRVLSHRSFSRQHYRVCAVQHGISDIKNLSSRWQWARDHAFHHLRRGDHATV